MTTYWIFWNDRVIFTGTENPMPQEVQSHKRTRYDAADTEEIVYDFKVISNLSFCSELIEYLIDNIQNDPCMHAMLVDNILFFNAQITSHQPLSSNSPDLHGASSSISSGHSDGNSQIGSSESPVSSSHLAPYVVIEPQHVEGFETDHVGGSETEEQSSTSALVDHSDSNSQIDSSESSVASPGEASISSDDIPILAFAQVVSSSSPTGQQLYAGGSEVEDQSPTNALAALGAIPGYTSWINFMISMSAPPANMGELVSGF